MGFGSAWDLVDRYGFVFVWGYLWIGTWLACALLAGWLNAQRGRNPVVWFLIGLATGPLGVIAVGLAPRRDRDDEGTWPGELATCDLCGADGPAGALRCRRCRGRQICPDCLEPVRMGATVCRYCGHTFEVGQEDAGAPADG